VEWEELFCGHHLILFYIISILFHFIYLLSDPAFRNIWFNFVCIRVIYMCVYPNYMNKCEYAQVTRVSQMKTLNIFYLVIY
jgi:hypothetical protein